MRFKTKSNLTSLLFLIVIILYSLFVIYLPGGPFLTGILILGIMIGELIMKIMSDYFRDKTNKLFDRCINLIKESSDLYEKEKAKNERLKKKK